MPRSNRATVIGIRWIKPGLTRFTLSTGQTVENNRLEGVGHNIKKAGPDFIIIHEVRYENEIPAKEMRAWNKCNIQHMQAKQDESKSLAELARDEELVTTLPVKKRSKK